MEVRICVVIAFREIKAYFATSKWWYKSYTQSFVHENYFHSSFGTIRKSKNVHTMQFQRCVCKWVCVCVRVCVKTQDLLNVNWGWQLQRVHVPFWVNMICPENVCSQIIYGINFCTQRFLVLTLSVATNWTSAEWKKGRIAMWNADYIPSYRDTCRWITIMHSFINVSPNYSSTFLPAAIPLLISLSANDSIQSTNNEHSQCDGDSQALMHRCCSNDDDDIDNDNSQSSLRDYWSIERYHMLLSIIFPFLFSLVIYPLLSTILNLVVSWVSLWQHTNVSYQMHVIHLFPHSA